MVFFLIISVLSLFMVAYIDPLERALQSAFGDDAGARLALMLGVICFLLNDVANKAAEAITRAHLVDIFPADQAGKVSTIFVTALGIGSCSGFVFTGVNGAARLPQWIVNILPSGDANGAIMIVGSILYVIFAVVSMIASPEVSTLAKGDKDAGETTAESSLTEARGGVSDGVRSDTTDSSAPFLTSGREHDTQLDAGQGVVGDGSQVLGTETQDVAGAHFGMHGAMWSRELFHVTRTLIQPEIPSVCRIFGFNVARWAWVRQILGTVKAVRHVHPRVMAHVVVSVPSVAALWVVWSFCTTWFAEDIFHTVPGTPEYDAATRKGSIALGLFAMCIAVLSAPIVSLVRRWNMLRVADLKVQAWTLVLSTIGLIGCVLSSSRGAALGSLVLVAFGSASTTNIPFMTIPLMLRSAGKYAEAAVGAGGINVYAAQGEREVDEESGNGSAQFGLSSGSSRVIIDGIDPDEANTHPVLAVIGVQGIAKELTDRERAFVARSYLATTVANATGGGADCMDDAITEAIGGDVTDDTSSSYGRLRTNTGDNSQARLVVPEAPAVVDDPPMGGGHGGDALEGLNVSVMYTSWLLGQLLLLAIIAPLVEIGEADTERPVLIAAVVLQAIATAINFGYARRFSAYSSKLVQSGHSSEYAKIT